MVPLCGSFIISATWCQRKCVRVHPVWRLRLLHYMFPRCENPTKRGVSSRSDPWDSGEDNTPSSSCRILLFRKYIPGTILYALALYTRTIRTIFLILPVRFFDHRHCCWTASSFGWPNKCHEEKRVSKWYHNVWSKDWLPVSKCIIEKVMVRADNLELFWLLCLSDVLLAWSRAWSLNHAMERYL